MRSKFRFPKPYPLSSAYQLRKRQQADYIGLPVKKEQSIYFYWYQFLRRSNRYKIACGNNGKGMKSIYQDFGDVFTLSFWDWWFENDDHGVERGARLFAVENIDAVQLLYNRIEPEFFLANDRLLISISRLSTRAQALSELKKILSNSMLASSRTTTMSTPKYSAESKKVDVNSLAKCLTAYDLKCRGRSNTAIGAISQGISEKKNAEFFEIYEKDYRTAKRFNSFVELPETDAFGKKLKVQKSDSLNMRSRPMTKSIHNFFDRDRKSYLISHAHRLIKKAEANISGVEKGIFPRPHKKPTYRIGKRIET